MKIKGIITEDFVNYKKPSLYIAFPRCSFKCDKENHNLICQNSSLAREPDIEIEVNKLINYYINNPITQSLVIAGLEPFDTYDDLILLTKEFRKISNDDIIIYTGYTEEEISSSWPEILKTKNLVIKYGRFIPNDKKHFDSILGVELASSNQYAKEYNR